jgi:putative ABC transport system permease protein
MSHQQDYSQFLVLANNPNKNHAIGEKIRAIIAKNHGADPSDPQIINSIDSFAAQNQTSDFMLGMQIFLGLIGGITLAVAGIGIANVIFASVHSSTKQIGIQIAIGAQTKHIVMHYLLESIIVSSIGGALGIILSYILVFISSHINYHSQFAKMLGNPKPEMSLGVLISVIIVLSITGLLAGFFPARKAAMIDPAEALRHD